MKHIAVIVMCMVAGCAASSPKENLCADSPASRSMLSAKAHVAINGQALLPDWSKKTKEHFLFDIGNVSYMVDFSGPPVLYAEVFFTCNGTSVRVRINRWGTLGE